MRKHQFVKVKCECFKRATNFKCKHCGMLEYKSAREIKHMNKQDAACPSQDAPLVPASESFKGLLGGVIDCLAPDYETYSNDAENGGSGAAKCDNC